MGYGRIIVLVLASVSCDRGSNEPAPEMPGTAGMETSSRTFGADGVPLVFVPAGSFYYCDDCWRLQDDRQTLLHAFFTDETEVTVEMYERCIADGACDSLGNSTPNPAACTINWPTEDQIPMNCISWEDARTYCGWAGRRLPSDHGLIRSLKPPEYPL